MAELPRRRLLQTAAVAGGALLLGAPATAAADDPADVDLHLPAPTGPHPVGATVLHLTDTSRPDPWSPESDTRELMVTVWYPTRERRGTRTRYMTAEESRLYLEGKRAPDLPPAVLSTVRTHALVDAPPAGRPGSRPLVILSPGYTQPRVTLTALAEDLASHGYVAAAIDHTGETYAVTFPDGRVAGCSACALDGSREFMTRVHRSRAADVSFVITRLTAPSGWRGARLVDASRIGMSGHSAGGASAIPAMLDDPRVRAGVDMDGSTSDLIPAGGLDRPFLFLGTRAHHSPGGPDESWDRDWGRLTGWRRWVTVDGTEHTSFNDIAVLADQLGLDYGATTRGIRAVEVTRRYNRALFDLQLRRRPQPLLERASARYPEVEIARR
ncbi:alpha/beta hydrolase [Streptomyces sp. NPDC051940]|uniref:alpha/beta hydrolase family protein n=1 Tax=Streptomyces sp. NPDC051940 TaxID=3155675 RepID=UPI0034125335